MARVTVEDCVTKVPNRFELVLLSSQRARDLAAGATATVEKENDKNPVMALREIAERTVSTDELRRALVYGLQKHVEIDEPDEDNMALLAPGDSVWGGTSKKTDSASAANSQEEGTAEGAEEPEKAEGMAEGAGDDEIQQAQDDEQDESSDENAWAVDKAPSDEDIRNLGEDLIEDPADLPGDEE